MDKRIIIGLGTGRCGTVSFSQLLSYQGVDSTHENFLLPWVFDKNMSNRMIGDLLGRAKRIVADTAFYHLPYIGHYISTGLDMKFICLKRDINETIESYMKKTAGRNHWMDDSKSTPDPKWDKCYPTYTRQKTKADAIAFYWKEYYQMATVYQEMYPKQFKIYDYYDVLNNEESQQDMFRFICLDEPKILTNIKKNQSR